MTLRSANPEITNFYSDVSVSWEVSLATTAGSLVDDDQFISNNQVEQSIVGSEGKGGAINVRISTLKYMFNKRIVSLPQRCWQSGPSCLPGLASVAALAYRGSTEMES